MRILLLLLTNLAVIIPLGVLAHLLGATHYIVASGLDLPALMSFCAIFGFGGALISLLISRPVAKWTARARVISGAEGATEAWLVAAVQQLADKAGIGMPQVAIFDGEPNAFATGATKNSSLIAVSTGLLQSMNRPQVEAVLAHEVAHVANGDMVTLTLLQGVLNTFVMFLARVVGYCIDRTVLRNEGKGPGLGYVLSVAILEALFGLGAAIVIAWFGRQREYRADSGAARLLGGPDDMVSALQVLATRHTAKLEGSLAAFGIAGGPASWFASHPPIESRIAALRAPK